jgi:hypothetical protein
LARRRRVLALEFRETDRMFQPRATFPHDHEAIVNKFAQLVSKAKELVPYRTEGFSVEDIALWFECRTSALNLLERTAGDGNIYYRLLIESQDADPDTFRPGPMLGILKAALTDLREGFMVDAKLLVSAEVCADFLVQAEILLEQDYKDAAAVIIRAVLEDGLRRVCISKGIEVKPRWGVDDLASQLTKRNVLTGVQKAEIDGKRELGNSAAHGRFDEYTKDDVVAFHEFVQRLLATII